MDSKEVDCYTERVLGGCPSPMTPYHFAKDLPPDRSSCSRERSSDLWGTIGLAYELLTIIGDLIKPVVGPKILVYQ